MTIWIKIFVKIQFTEPFYKLYNFPKELHICTNKLKGFQQKTIATKLKLRKPWDALLYDRFKGSFPMSYLWYYDAKSYIVQFQTPFKF